MLSASVAHVHTHTLIYICMWVCVWIPKILNVTKIWELIFYLLRTFPPHFGCFFFFCVFVVSAKFHLRPSSGDLLRPRIGMLNLVTVSPVIIPQLLSIAPRFWPSKPLAGLGRIWNRYLLTMKFGQNLVKEETTQKKVVRWRGKVRNK